MKMETTSYGSRPTILAADDYTAVPFHNRSDELIKAGTPHADNYNHDCSGVVLYDTPAGENGALVVYGVIDVPKAMAACNYQGGDEYDYMSEVKDICKEYDVDCQLTFRIGIKNQG